MLKRRSKSSVRQSPWRYLSVTRRPVRYFITSIS